MSQNDTRGTLAASGRDGDGPKRHGAVAAVFRPGVAAAAAILVIVYLSWSPAGAVPRSGAPGPLEHLAAYSGVGALAALAASAAHRRWVGVALVLLAGTLEVGQIWIPGRTAQLVDFAASSAGALIGMACAELFRGRLLLALLLAGALLTPIWIGLLAWGGWSLLATLIG